MMKRLLLLLAAAALAAPASAQSLWAAPGATWTYGYSYFSQYGDLTMTYAGATTVGGQAALRYTRQLLTKDMAAPASPARTFGLPDLVLRADADRLYVQADDQQFYTLYNFAAQPGDSWLTPATTPYMICANTLLRLRVDSVGTAVVNGTSRRWLRLRVQTQAGQLPAMNYAWGGRIYEGIGPKTTYLTPQGMSSCGGTDPGSMEQLLCFRAAGQTTVYGSTSQQCSNIITATAEQRATQLSFEVYPNPSQGELHLRLPATAGPQPTVALHDLTGRCLLRTALPASGTLDVRQLPKGLYALSVRLPGQAAPATRRVVLE